MEEKNDIENDTILTEDLKRYVPSRDDMIIMLLNRALNRDIDTRSKRSLIEEALELLKKEEKPEEEVIEDTINEAEELVFEL